MYCSKCGSQNDDSSMFCLNCGESFKKEATAPVVETPVKKKKSKKLPIIIGVAVLVIFVIIIGSSSEGSIDYVATVQAHKPFVAQGTSLTYGTVLNAYIESPKWEVRESGDVAYVDVSGTIKGTDDKEMLVTIEVAPNESNSGSILIDPISVTVAGVKSPTQNDAVKFLCDMFFAYEDGYEDISEVCDYITEIF